MWGVQFGAEKTVNTEHAQPFLWAGAGEGHSLAEQSLPHPGNKDSPCDVSEGCLAPLAKPTPRAGPARGWVEGEGTRGEGEARDQS